MVTTRKPKELFPAGIPTRLENLVTYAPGSVVSKTIVKQPGGTLTLFAFDAGQGLPEHSAPFDAVVQLLEGEVQLVIGGETLVAKGPGTVVMPANIPHSVKALSPFKMLLTMIRH